LMIGVISFVISGIVIGALAHGVAPGAAVAIVVLFWCFVGILGFIDRNRES